MEISYSELLHRASSECDSFSLVWRDQLNFNENASEIEIRLEQFKIKEERVNEWPGTVLSKAEATLRTYRVTKKSIGVLRAVNDIYDWLSPNFPEDLAFFKSGQVWFASIAHEKESWFAEA